MRSPSNANPPRLRGVSHLTLPVGDLDRAERFYLDVVGLELVRRVDAELFAAHVPDRAAELGNRDSPLHLELRCAGVELHLFLQVGHRRDRFRPHPHLAFELDAGEFESALARLRELEVPFDGPRRLGLPGQASVYFPDPWGNLLEFATSDHAGEVPIGPPDLERLADRFAAFA